MERLSSSLPPAEIAGPEVAAAASPDPAAHAAQDPASPEAWRDELSDRLNRYRARRKTRPPRYPSLNLRFDAFESAPSPRPSRTALPEFEPVSNQALALDGTRYDPSPAQAEITPQYPRPPRIAPEIAPAPVRQIVRHDTSRPATAKIIEFPRFAWAPPPPPPDQLAEPVFDRPRILDVPEVEPPPPALGGITIEAVEPKAVEKRPGIDIPLQSAPLGLRILAALVDGIITAAASAFFGFIFWKIAAFRPPQAQMLSLGAAIPCLFWATYQYLLIVYAGSTPGLRLARLRLARFNGTATSRSLRRWRVLAAWLSAVSLGMGYVWVFLDEDALCWHDRITHTYFAPRS